MRRATRNAAPPRAAVFVVLVFALVVTLGACSSSPYKGLTKAEFLRQANEACAHPSKAGKDAHDQLAVQLVPERKAQIYLEKVLPLFDRELDHIAALKPPKADRDQVKKILSEARADSKVFATGLKADPQDTLSSKIDPFQKSSDMATAYGLKICAA
jgi:hypothetical protein